jgi:hypothetical protein
VADLTLSSATLNVNAAVSLTDLTLDSATLNVDAATSIASLTLSGNNGGTVDVESGTLTITGNVTGNGSLEIGNGAELELQGTSSTAVTFEGATGTLDLTQPSSIEIMGFTGTAPDSGDSDEIELSGAWTTQSTLTGNGGNLAVALTNGNETITLTFDGFNGSLNVSNNGTDTFIFDPPATNSPNGSVSVGDDHFVFHPHLGAAAPDETGGHDQFAWAAGEDWSALIGSTLSDTLFEGAHYADGEAGGSSSAAYWHHALQNAVHLH